MNHELMLISWANGQPQCMVWQLVKLFGIICELYPNCNCHIQCFSTIGIESNLQSQLYQVRDNCELLRCLQSWPEGQQIESAKIHFVINKDTGEQFELEAHDTTCFLLTMENAINFGIFAKLQCCIAAIKDVIVIKQ